MVDGELGLREAIKCLVNESPGRLPPLPSRPRPVNVYRGWLAQGQGSVTVLVGDPASLGGPGQANASLVPAYLPGTTLACGFMLEEEEEGCQRSAMDLATLGPSSGCGMRAQATSWPRSLPLLSPDRPSTLLPPIPSPSPSIP